MLTSLANDLHRIVWLKQFTMAHQVSWLANAYSVLARPKEWNRHISVEVIFL